MILMADINTQRVPVTDDYMFAYVMRHKDICTRVLQCLLPKIGIKRIVYKDENGPETQKTIQGSIDARSIRLDVYVDDSEKVCNVEMQTGTRTNLPKRSRFYGGAIDCDNLKKSQDYNQLKPTYVIFICTFDPFGRGQYVYTFENRCEEEEDLKLNDGSYKIFINTKGTKGNISDELKELLAYFNDPTETMETAKTELVREIDEVVDYANQDADWRRGYMTFMQAQMDAANQGRAEGQNDLASLIDQLLKMGRMSDVERVVRDTEYRAEMLGKFQLQPA